MKSGINGLSTVAALVVTVFTTPWFTALTEEWAMGLLIYFYGSAYAYVMSWFWFAICGAAIFFASLAVLSVTFMNVYAAIQECLFPA